jgi:D-methionine transport system substrate-binding protein
MKSLSLFFAALFLSACSGTSSSEKKILVAASAVPHAEILEVAKEELRDQRIDLDIAIVNDYNLPNRMLAEKEVDANFFQHLPFLESQINMQHYPIRCLVKVHIEPMGLYSKKLTTLKDIPDKASFAIPNDPANEGRALLLLHHHGLIRLKNPNDLLATVHDIVENPYRFTFMEIDSAFLARSLSEVTLAIIPTNFALEAGLNPLKNALLVESADSPYVNIIAIRDSDGNKENFAKLKTAVTSDKVKQFILDKFQGAIIPAFGDCQ